MKLLHLTAHRFTAFEDATFDLAAGVNVFIGENGTGKSHVLKLLYALSESARRFVKGDTLDVTGSQGVDLAAIVGEMLASVFRPDSLGRLVRRGQGRRSALVELGFDGGSLKVTLSSLGKVTAKLTGDFTALGRAIFLPPREVLSLFPGFVSAYTKRELEFDRTYYDLCLALDAKPLRGARDEKRAKLLAPIEHALGGRVALENGRFYVELPSGKMEAHLVAEGLRKLAMMAQLVINGALLGHTALFWDEPEANMNPKLSQALGRLVFELAAQGVQVFLATHDYMLTSDVSLVAEQDPGWRAQTAFFGLGAGAEGAVVERGAVVTDLQTNPILDALAALHERERAAFAGEGASSDDV